MRPHICKFMFCRASAWLRLFVSLMLLGIGLQAHLPDAQAQGGTPQLILTKEIEGGATTARVGDVIRYRIRFECSSLVGPCGQLEITDVLQPGLIYLPPPNSSVPAGFSIDYDADTRTVILTKDDNNLLDGSQYDAVIAVKVDYDLRPLPAQVTNTVGGRIYPSGATSWQEATPKSALPINIGTVSPSWELTKSLFRPTINPTINTDVTYQIQLCPVTPVSGGNVPLRDVEISDTLPTGATFVSASNSGDQTSPGIVTWPVIAGPVYPPDCVTRYVTVRYNSPTFSVGNNITNTATASGEYTASDEEIIGPLDIDTDPIDHPIDPISQVPNYSKTDAGDPIGIDGLGRFYLHLDTDGTNYPSNELILIDNIPPQLQVTGVTSGSWDAAFDYVQATIEYSTNNGTTYTPFSGQPVGYNTNGIYTAPAANITNLRWRFEYDPDGEAPFTFTQAGLPYTWSFTTSPEIRFIPRATTTTADLPSGATLPAATAGSKYTNCLQVSRRDNANNSVTDPCSTQDITIQGELAILRVSKNETPGTGWNDVEDPNIDYFVEDTSLLPGDTLRYTLAVELTERSSTPLVDPTILDTLPAGLTFVRNGTAKLDDTALPAAQQPTFSQPAANQLMWKWDSLPPIDPLPIGSHTLTVEFYALIPRGQTPGERTNNLYVVTDSADVKCEIGSQVEDSTNGDIDGDGDPTDPACTAEDKYTVERSAALRGEKWIRANDASNSQVIDSATFEPAACPDGGTVGLSTGGSNSFTRYPCVAQALPDGAFDPGRFYPPATSTALDDFEYNLRIFNDGNVDMLNYVLYDILPYVGDTGSGGTLSATARQSEFRPVMRGAVEFISGPGLTTDSFTIEYNTTTNPCRPEVFNLASSAIAPAGCNNSWSTTWSAAARSYRIRLKSNYAIQPASTSSEVRFGIPMSIPADAPTIGTLDANDPQSKEIAWNSYSHVGSYDKDPRADVVAIQDLLASEPRKVGITIPERLSIGNRVWRDSDNSGTINAADDSLPGISGVTVNLYRDVDNNGAPDGAAIATITTDTRGYYLFSNIPYDSATPGNNRYIIGIPASNFASSKPLENLRSSSGTAYITPPEGNGDRNDNGIDPATPGQEVFSASFLLGPASEPAAESDLSSNSRDGISGARRGLSGEKDAGSDLTIDFGFFGGSDIPFSIGNQVWYDNGNGGGVLNDGIRQLNEPPVVGALVRLYRDGNNNGSVSAGELVHTDTTDANGYYLFDNLDPGPYFVEIPASEFAVGKPLAGWYSSVPTGTELAGVTGNPNTPSTDLDDNGVNTNVPDTAGVFSGVIVLARGTDEATGETDLSEQTDPGAPANATFSPTGWDGPLSRGRFGESDKTSNLTIDFGFIPPLSLGNRVWIDEGAGGATFGDGFNDGLQGGSEPGVAGVRVELWRDTNTTPGLQTGGDTLVRYVNTDAAGFYLFDRLQPGDNYYVHISASNFASGSALYNYVSSVDTAQATSPADDAEDKDDAGLDALAPATSGVTSPKIVMAYGSEPLNEADLPASTAANITAYGSDLRGRFGQVDENSNLTVDFGFIHPPRSLGNRLWLDANNNGQIDTGELPVPAGVRVSLYKDTNSDSQPDDLGAVGDRSDDAVRFDITDANGYYLFDGLPAGGYIVGVDRVNFAAGGLLEGYTNSTGSVDNATNDTDRLDNGIDRLDRADVTASPHGILSTSINLTATPAGTPTGEAVSGDTGTTAGFSPTGGDGPQSRGRFGESDDNSDLTIDFGFFRGLSLGNRVFMDDGSGAGGVMNDGIMNGTEAGVVNVRVELYSDDGADGTPDELIGFDITDANGYYLFDNVPEGNYVVVIPAGNFAASFDPDGSGPLSAGPGALLDLYSSTPTASENIGVNGNPYTPGNDRDDNGINAVSPATAGVSSGTIALSFDSEPPDETELSGQANPGASTNLTFNPTGWDGPTSRGRWDESDANSNLTIDFGFIPVFSLGNRVWFDTNNNSIMEADESAIADVTVQLYSADGLTEIPVGPDGILGSADDAAGGMKTGSEGYYLFNNLPAGNYLVVIPASNFDLAAPSHPLAGTWSSGTSRSNTGAVAETPAAAANGDLATGMITAPCRPAAITLAL